MFPLLIEDVHYTPKGAEQPLIQGISACIEQNGSLMILGPNGAGKSLFLRLAHQLIQPSSGNIKWGNLTTETRPNNQSMVFQHPIMLNRSVEGNLHYALKLKRGHTFKQRAQLIQRGLVDFGLAQHRQQHANTLSLGEQQKLAILRAIITEPEVIFLDEPTASLDPSATHQIEDMLNSIAHKTKLIMATHNLAQAKRLGDEVLFIDQGKIVEQTPAPIFFNKPTSSSANKFLSGELLWN